MDNNTQNNPTDQQNSQQPADASPFASPQSAQSNQSPQEPVIQKQQPTNNNQAQTKTSETQALEPQETIITSSGNGGGLNKKNIKIIGGMTVLLFLVVGTIIGVWALQRNQTPERSSATACSDWCTSAQECAAAGGTETTPCSFSFCSEGLIACIQEGSNTGTGDACTVEYPGGVTGSIVISAGCSSIPFDAYYRAAEPGTTDGDCVGTNENSLGTKNLGPGTHNPRDYGPGGCGYCVQLDQADGGQGGSAQYTGDCPTPTPTPTPTSPGGITTDPTSTPTPTPTATPTPTPTAPGDRLSCSCIDMKIYDTDFVEIPNTELSSLKPGDNIKLAVVSNSSDDGITQARFVFNGITRDPVATRVPNKPDEFYEEITIPEPLEGKSTLEISVNAQLYHPEIGWF